jgi:hypothetical protein
VVVSCIRIAVCSQFGDDAASTSMYIALATVCMMMRMEDEAMPRTVELKSWLFGGLFHRDVSS